MFRGRIQSFDGICRMERKWKQNHQTMTLWKTGCIWGSPEDQTSGQSLKFLIPIHCRSSFVTFLLSTLRIKLFTSTLTSMLSGQGQASYLLLPVAQLFGPVSADALWEQIQKRQLTRCSPDPCPSWLIKARHVNSACYPWEDAETFLKNPCILWFLPVLKTLLLQGGLYALGSLGI